MYICIDTSFFFNFRLLELLRSKLSKTNEDLDTIESIEVAIEKIQKNLHDLQAEVPAVYVWGENLDTTEALLKVSVYYLKRKVSCMQNCQHVTPSFLHCLPIDVTLKLVIYVELLILILFRGMR
jgi:hypothetical protein